MSLKYRNKETGQMVEVIDAGYPTDEDTARCLTVDDVEKRMNGPNSVNWHVTVFFKANGVMQSSMLKVDFLKGYEQVEDKVDKDKFSCYDCHFYVHSKNPYCFRRASKYLPKYGNKRGQGRVSFCIDCPLWLHEQVPINRRY